MSKMFFVEFPTCFPNEKKEKLIAFIEQFTFMPMPPCAQSNCVKFFFEGDKYTVESFRKTFDIPGECLVVEL